MGFVTCALTNWIFFFQGKYDMRGKRRGDTIAEW